MRVASEPLNQDAMDVEHQEGIEFDGHSPPTGFVFERGLYEVQVLGDYWADAEGWPKATRDRFNPKARYRRKAVVAPEP